METGFTLPTESSIKKLIKYMKQKFLRPRTSVDEDSGHWERENKEVSCTIAPISFQTTLRELTPEISLSWGDKAESSERPRWLEFTRQSTRKQRTAYRGNSRDMQRFSLEYSGGYRSASCMWVNCETMQKELPSALEGLVLSSYLHLDIVTLAANQTGKPYDS